MGDDEHYRRGGDPETGCGIMVIAAMAIVLMIVVIFLFFFVMPRGVQ